MTLWRYLKERMYIYADNIALENGTTYGKLIQTVEERAKQYACKNRLICVGGKNRAEHAVEILSVLASGNAVVPVDDCYGKNRREDIESRIAEDKEQYPELAFVMFTSGTGGKPKGVMLSHENIIANLQMIDSYFNISEQDRILIARPLVHIAVIVGELLYGLCKGATIQFYEDLFLPSKLKSAIIEKQTTVLGGTPTLFRNLLRADKSGFSLRACVISGERLSPDLAGMLSLSWHNTDFYNVYGLTEHSPRVSALLPQNFARYPGSVGKPLEGVQTKIQDGELLVKSPCVMQGYYKDEAKTNAKMQDGWLHTGDIAHVDENGYLYIDGRKDNMLIRSGLNIYPEEIESVAGTCDGVSNCIVYGEEDEVEGQKIILVYCGEISKQSLRKFLIECLDAHLLPRIIRKVNALPTTPSGKTVRKC